MINHSPLLISMLFSQKPLILLVLLLDRTETERGLGIMRDGVKTVRGHQTNLAGDCILRLKNRCDSNIQNA